MTANRSFWLAGFGALTLAAVITGECTAADKDPVVKDLVPAWSLNGAWTGIVGDPDAGVAYALDSAGKCVELDSEGKVRREFKLAGANGSVLRLANWSGEGGRVLLAFGVWSKALQAYDLEGKQLWTYPLESGIDDVWALKLQDDKSDGVIVGFNGGTGVYILDMEGKVRWKSKAIGNVWHVSAGDVWGKGTSQVVTTSARGQVHIFGSDGEERKDLDVGLYANMVRVGKLSEDDKTATIVVAGPSLVAKPEQAVGIVTALTADGQVKWSLELPAGGQPHADSASLAPQNPWFAVGMRGGQLYVIDAAKGTIVAGVKQQGMAPEVGWVTDKGLEKPVVIVATGGKLNAFRVPASKE